MKKHLVTQDLISSVDWCLKAPDSVIKNDPSGITWSKKAFKDLKDKLNRVYKDMPEAALRGIDFEKKIYTCAQSQRFNEGSEYFKQIVNRVKEHSFQEKVRLNKFVEKYDCFFYGKIDAYKFEDMIDIKTTANYDYFKYKNSFQSKLYCYCKKENRFTFIVVEWLDFPKIKKVHIIEIYYTDMKNLKEKIHEKILTCFQTLKDMDLWETYREKYCLY